MHVDPLMPVLAGLGLVVLILGLVLRRLKQPAILGYLLAGVLFGPHVLRLVPAETDLGRIGGIGVVFLLFFVGMEMKPERLLANWRLVLAGTAFQVAVSVGCVLALGSLLGWPAKRSILLGFVISLSSTAIVLRLLQRRKETETRLGEDVIGILLAQDVAIVPMLIAVGLMGGEAPSVATIAGQVVGFVLIGGIVAVIARRRDVRLGIGALVGDDHELQVFAALILVFGLAVMTGFLSLSTALGAFVGGMLVAAAKETHWVHDALAPFRVVFLALFFVSIGMLLDLDFLVRNWLLVGALVGLALVTNTVINAGILRVWSHGWRESVYGGALLAPIGELSYVLIAVGKQSGMVSDFAYQATVATITLSLMVSPFWVLAGRGLGASSA